MKINPLTVTFTPLAGSTFTNLIRMIAQNRFSIGIIGIPRVMYSLLMSSILSPLNVVEKIQFKTKIAKMRIDKDPIFILDILTDKSNGSNVRGKGTGADGCKQTQYQCRYYWS